MIKLQATHAAFGASTLCGRTPPIASGSVPRTNEVSDVNCLLCLKKIGRFLTLFAHSFGVIEVRP